MFIAKKHMPRRTFLRGAGVTLSLPLLSAMIPAQKLLLKLPQIQRLGLWGSSILMEWLRLLGTSGGSTSGKAVGNHGVSGACAKSNDGSGWTVVGVCRTSRRYHRFRPLGRGRISQCQQTQKDFGSNSTVFQPTIDQVIAEAIGKESILPSLHVAVEDPNIVPATVAKDTVVRTRTRYPGFLPMIRKTPKRRCRFQWNWIPRLCLNAFLAVVPLRNCGHRE